MYKEKIDAYFDKNSDKMLDALARLIRINSVRGEAKEGKPFGEGPYEALMEANKIAEELGFSPKTLKNCVAFNDICDKETELTIFAHLDVVPEGEGWRKPAFEATIEGGKIYGRGTIDDKGPAMAALFALAAAREIEPNLSKNARLVLGTAEETGHEDMEIYFEQEKKSPYSFTPDADFPVVNIEKGRYAPLFGASWEEDKALPRIISIKGSDTVNQVPAIATATVEGIDIDMLEEFADMIAENSGAGYELKELEGDLIKINAHGKSAHAYEPEKGNNALTALLFLLSHLNFAKSQGFMTICALNCLFPHGDLLGKELGIAQKDELSGELTLVLSVMEYNLTGITARFDCRFPICGTKENIADKSAAILKANSIEIKDFNVLRIPHYTPADTPFVKTLLKAYEEWTGSKGECLVTGGGTYVHGIEGAVSFGCMMPGVDNHIHGADEFIDTEIYIKSAKMFTQAILEICK